jgi:hypothetical protein
MDSLVDGAAQYAVSLLTPDGARELLFRTRPYHKFIDCGHFAKCTIARLARVHPDLAGNFDGARLHVFVVFSDQRWTKLKPGDVFLVNCRATVVAIKYIDPISHSPVTHQFCVEVSL